MYIHTRTHTYIHIHTNTHTCRVCWVSAPRPPAASVSPFLPSPPPPPPRRPAAPPRYVSPLLAALAALALLLPVPAPAPHPPEGLPFEVSNRGCVLKVQIACSRMFMLYRNTRAHTYTNRHTCTLNIWIYTSRYVCKCMFLNCGYRGTFLERSRCSAFTQCAD